MCRVAPLIHVTIWSGLTAYIVTCVERFALIIFINIGRPSVGSVGSPGRRVWQGKLPINKGDIFSKAFFKAFFYLYNDLIIMLNTFFGQ